MKRLWLCLPVLALCLPLLIFLAGAASHPAAAPPVGPVVITKAVAQPADDPTAELAEHDPVAFLEKCLQHYDETVHGYDCTLAKQERIGGVMQPKEVIEAHFKQHPFSVFMRWLQGAKKADAVLYVAGENNGKLLARPSGALARRIVGDAVPRPVNGPEAKQSGRVTVDEFGMKKSLIHTLNAWKIAREHDALHVEYLGVQKVKELDDRPCYVLRREYDQPEDDGVRELTTYIDEQTLLQTGSVVKDKDGQLIGVYFFRDVKLNPTFKADQFTPAALKW
jgi:hypothetical protein